MNHDHEHDEHEEGHGHNHARVSTAEERALLEPFVDDVHRFLVAALAGVDGPIVEVGAGDGVNAQRLRDEGFDVIAIDGNEATAAAATEQGREVLHADWRKWDGGGRGPFAAVLFTRSLHHIVPVEHATDQLVRLAPGGLVVADEFAREVVDEAGAQLLLDGQAIMAAAGMSDKEPVVTADPLAAWQHRMEVDHEVTTGARFMEAIGQIAEVQQQASGRFYARMLTHSIEPTHPQAAELRDLFIALEDTRLATGSLAAVGLRFIARVRS